MAKPILRAFICAVLVQAVGAQSAGADGLPVLGLEATPAGISAAGGQARYATRRAGRYTRLEQRSRSGRVLNAVRLPGRFVVPVVAYDGSVSGLSGDGQTLVLIRPRVTFPQASTRMEILDTPHLRARQVVALRGDFSLDAISPNGRWIYLVQYTSRFDPTRYRVRALDAHSGRLLRHDILDPSEGPGSMRGNPLTRAVSLDGRWAYTLYAGVGHPFVHALDTTSRQARCLDLPVFPSNIDPFSARLKFTEGGTRLLVTIDQRTVATIDTRTLRVSGPPRPTRHFPRAIRSESAVFLAALSIGALAVIVLLFRVQRFRCPAIRTRRCESPSGF